MSSNLGQEIIQNLLFSWTLNRKDLQVSGLNSTATAFYISQLLMKSHYRLALICPDADSAQKLLHDVRTFLTLFNGEAFISKTDLFPGWETSPFQSFNPSVKDRVRRLRSLSSLSDQSLRLVVTDLVSFSQKIPSKEELSIRSFSIQVSDIFSREELILKLEKAGYSKSDPVEDPGSYSFRGGLLDLFSPSSRRPFRIEFFDDMVESIKTYDPISQRSDAKSSQEKIKIVPVTEFSFEESSKNRARSKIKEFSDEYEIPKQRRDEIYEKFDLGIRDPSLDYLFPYFLEQKPVSLLDYLSSDDWKLGFIDSLSSWPSYDKWLKKIKNDFEEAIKEKKIIAPIEEVYTSTEELSTFIKTKIDFRIEPVNLGVPEEKPQDEEEKPDPNFIHFQLNTNQDIKPQESLKNSHEHLFEKFYAWTKSSFVRIIICSSSVQADRIKYLLNQKEILSEKKNSIESDNTSVFQILDGSLTEGFRLPHYKFAVVTDSEIFGPKKLKLERKKNPTKEANNLPMESFVPSLEDLNPDELIVHQMHGIGRYKGLVKLTIDNVESDFLFLEYAGNDKLYLPIYRLDQVQRYIGSNTMSSLDKLGSQNFEKTKQKIKGELQDLAARLLELYAQRQMREGFSYSPADEIFTDFEAKFPYAETQDQIKAIDDVMSDMQSAKIMDRLICGDVGFGKTEVAIRAAVKAALDGKQVAVLVPTTILAVQHERSFRERIEKASLPIKLESLSRFKTNKEIKDTIEKLKEGKVDIAIGTHRLLSKDIQFKDLGLLVVDEEQRFGVEHKERLKNLKVNTDVLTLTATPIPRTLNIALMGLRDISVISTPPVDRLSVRTYVSRFDETVIRNAIQNELSRGGQVFFIHNRVNSIHAMYERIQTIVPDAKIIVAHGQLDEKDLEQRMLDFYNKKGNVLLCSTIIESGLDIPSANTMIINRADMFGVSQLYQLRGRVGRSQVRAYCYLLLPEEGAVTEESKKRLDVIQRFVDLGSGFKIASHDLELRGGGDVLGKNQSGQIAAIGFELYSELLEETIREIKGQPSRDHFDPEIKLPVSCLIPEDYIFEVHQRLGLYKRLSQTEDLDSLHQIELEMVDRFGKFPKEVENLLWLIKMKQDLKKYHIRSLTVGAEKVVLDASSGAKLKFEKAISFVKKNAKIYSITPESKIIIKRAFQTPEQLFQDVHVLLNEIGE